MWSVLSERVKSDRRRERWLSGESCYERINWQNMKWLLRTILITTTLTKWIRSWSQRQDDAYRSQWSLVLQQTSTLVFEWRWRNSFIVWTYRLKTYVAQLDSFSKQANLKIVFEVIVVVRTVPVEWWRWRRQLIEASSGALPQHNTRRPHQPSLASHSHHSLHHQQQRLRLLDVLLQYSVASWQGSGGNCRKMFSSKY